MPEYLPKNRNGKATLYQLRRNFCTLMPKKHGYEIVREFIDVEIAKQSGKTQFSNMVQFLEEHPRVRIILCEKTDRLYRNIKDYVTIDELDVTLIFVKEGSVLNKYSRSHEKFIHGIKVLMVKNYIDNLSEETRGCSITAEMRHVKNIVFLNKGLY